MRLQFVDWDNYRNQTWDGLLGTEAKPKNMNSSLERHKIQIVKARTILRIQSSNSHHEETSINAEGISSSKKEMGRDPNCSKWSKEEDEKCYDQDLNKVMGEKEERVGEGGSVCAGPPLYFTRGACDIWVLGPVHWSDYSRLLSGPSCLETLVSNFLKTYKLILGWLHPPNFINTSSEWNNI